MTPSYYHYDQVGSVVGLTGGTKLTDSYSYEAFGSVRTRSGTSAAIPRTTPPGAKSQV
ncbi:MAG: hypothetical protein M3338_02095 [Actinomycetota bacterium]|nr:hypothetical protein [Actinomycetota bacterium]